MGEDEKSAHDFNPKTESHSNLSNTATNHLKGTNMHTKLWTEKCIQEESLPFLSSKTEKKEQNEV